MIEIKYKRCCDNNMRMTIKWMRATLSETKPNENLLEYTSPGLMHYTTMAIGCRYINERKKLLKMYIASMILQILHHYNFTVQSFNLANTNTLIHREKKRTRKRQWSAQSCEERRNSLFCLYQQHGVVVDVSSLYDPNFSPLSYRYTSRIHNLHTTTVDKIIIRWYHLFPLLLLYNLAS